jgi:hypothetical protein
MSPSEQIPSVATMRTAITASSLPGTLRVEAGDEEDWTQLILSHTEGAEIAAIERNTFTSDGLVSAEIDEFLDEVADCQPASAAAWLTEYLPTVKTVYAFQILRGVDMASGWDLLGQIKDSIFTQAGGIVQADEEGFSDEAGYHILWQFSKAARGPWWMGVLRDGEWVHFQMDLGNENHRAAFLRGEVPEGATFAE